MLKLVHSGAYPNIKTGWYFDKDDRRGIVHIKLERMSTSKEAELVLNIDENLKIAASPAYPVPVITPDLDKTEFTVTCNSQQGKSLTRAFDGTLETIWHSSYNKNDKKAAKKHPYFVNIALNGLYAVNSFEYTARQKGTNGLLKDYELYVSRDPQNMGKPVAAGSFTKDLELQKVEFTPVWGEYVQLKIINSHGSNNVYAAAAEFGVTRDMNAPPLADKVQYLSDMQPASSKGEFKNDKSIGGRTITVNETKYEKGIGAKSGSEIVYKLDGVWDTLYGHVGVDDEVGDGGSVMFRVYVDGKLTFESPEQSGVSVKQLMNINIRGAKELRLVLLDTGDGDKDDHGDWIDAKLILKGSE